MYYNLGTINIKDIKWFIQRTIYLYAKNFNRNMGKGAVIQGGIIIITSDQST